MISELERNKIKTRVLDIAYERRHVCPTLQSLNANILEISEVLFEIINNMDTEPLEKTADYFTQIIDSLKKGKQPINIEGCREGLRNTQ